MGPFDGSFDVIASAGGMFCFEASNRICFLFLGKFKALLFVRKFYDILDNTSLYMGHSLVVLHG